MVRRKKPTLKKFKEVSDKYGGNISSIAKHFNVWRTTIYDWANEDSEFKNVIDNHRGKVLDECFVTARLLAKGIPITEDNGRLIGWEERPDPSMVRYLLSTLGRNEGFGENVDVTSNGKTVSQGIQIEIIKSREQVVNEENTND